MVNNRKGNELSMNMIILTVLGLLVLLVLAFFIYKAVHGQNIALACENNNGTCVSTGQPCPSDGIISAFQSCPKDQKCCTGPPGG